MRTLAILLLLGLGLRRPDIAALDLSDIDARTKTMLVRASKSGWGARVPLSQEACDAILRYVRYARPHVRTNALFITMGFPYNCRMKAGSISHVVRKAFLRSGVEHPSKGALVLRYTFATRLVRAGTRLKTVADAMRHRLIDSTMNYINADLTNLKVATRSWPGGHHARS